MKKNCGHRSKCGCEDVPMTTNNNPCTTNDCIGDKCVETYCQQCISYCQDDMEFIVGNEELSIKRGERLDVVLQKMMVFFSNPACAKSTAYGLKSHKIDCTSLTLTWEGDDSLSYSIVVENMDLGGSVTTSVPQGLYQYDLTNLTPDTNYRLSIITDSTTCESVRINIKTLQR